MQHTPGRVDITSLLSDDAVAHLNSLPGKYQHLAGWTMKADDDDPDDEEDEDEEEEPLELDPETRIKVGNKELKVSDLTRIAAKEKREGRKSGQRALLKTLGFKSVDEVKDALAGVSKPKSKSTDDPDDKDDAAAQRAAERERVADEKARRADLRGALVTAGCPRDDLEDALAIFDRKVDDDYDEDELADLAEELKEKRPHLFGVTSSTDDDDEDDEDDEDEKARKRAQRDRPRGVAPRGKPGKKHAPQKKFGSEGLRRAERQGWIKTD